MKQYTNASVYGVGEDSLIAMMCGLSASLKRYADILLESFHADGDDVELCLDTIDELHDSMTAVYREILNREQKLIEEE